MLLNELSYSASDKLSSDKDKEISFVIKGTL